MVADMVTSTGDWDCDRLRDLLPSTVLEYMAATPPSLCHGGPEDINHVLRFCTKACELWKCVLGQEVANKFDALPFEAWLHGNINGSLVANAERGQWGMRFSIFCWLLWKLRCSMILDGEYVERESVLDRGTRFIMECKAVYSPLRSLFTAVPRCEQWGELLQFHQGRWPGLLLRSNSVRRSGGRHVHRG
ncbi:hypothetical protein V6N11_017437 [Hibiscus sabdariffa]|uniref:Reverse transcriptase zinc-binding domain-containing protein n=1 Tax=Hibiscus sabdariffa TaxID=183260 RepID=A0ABR2TY04_9ROSI